MALPPSGDSPDMVLKIFLPGSTLRQTTWDPRTASARIVGWATGISATDGSPRRSVVDKYVAEFWLFYPENIPDNLLILDSVDVEMRGPTKAKFVANYKVQTFNAGGSGPGDLSNIHTRPRTLSFATYRSYADPSATQVNERFVDGDGMPKGNMLGLRNECDTLSKPTMKPETRSTTELTVTVNLGQNPIDLFQAFSGALNSGPASILGITFGPGAIMFLGGTMEVFNNRFGVSFITTYHFDLDPLRHIEQAIFLDLNSTLCQAPAGNGTQWQVKNVPMGPLVPFVNVFLF